MADEVLEVSGVYKKFRRGELYGSLRDLVPALAKRLVSGKPKVELDQRDFWALQDVSFSVARGEAFAIIGGNGAGKSTLLKLLTGIMRQTRGDIRIAGRVSALIEVSAGFHPDLTGRENVYLNGAILGMTREEIARRFDAIVAFSGLSEFIDTPVKRYSSGMFARLGFSVAAHVDPDVLLVDEVLSVGDYLFQRKCVDRMNEVIASGATVIFVSHNLRAVANLCPRSLLLERGQVKMIGRTDDVIRAYHERGQQARASDTDRDVVISEVTIHDESGRKVEVETDSKLRITVKARARKRHEDMSVVIQIVDDHLYGVFDTCTQRLGGGSITLQAGETLECTFEIDVALAEGTFHVNAFLHRYLTDLPYDTWRSAATFFVKGVPEVRGLVTLHPRLTDCRVEATKSDGSEASEGAFE
ncbi:MAG TPA: ABC transporter ATP-binding protein [Myxococcota bacterium]|nr:ABC transporter ATP-binding protein [Myxococcota bacterium]